MQAFIKIYHILQQTSVSFFKLLTVIPTVSSYNDDDVHIGYLFLRKIHSVDLGIYHVIEATFLVGQLLGSGF